MNHEFVKRSDSKRLILIFAGWGMDANPFRHVSRPGYDTLVVWDYRDLSMDWSVVANYDEITLIAWSMGVYAASMTIHAVDHLITAKIAVNGTMTPVDNLHGIPEAIFEGTAATLDERNLRKFFRRMCGDRATTERFMLSAPQRPVGELVDELRAIYPEPWFANPKVSGWDRAVIGRQDAIFPACNQQRAWQGTPIVVLDRPHYIDLQEIADAYIIDKQQAAVCFDAGRTTYDANAPVQHAIVDALMADAARVKADKLIFSPGCVALEIGCGTGSLTRRLYPLTKRGFLHLWDTNTLPPEGFDKARYNQCDAELQICRTPTGRYDLIASASTVQWFNSPARFMAECLRVLRPGGILMLSAFQRGNMHELAAASGVSLSLPDSRQWQTMIPRGFETLSFETEDYDMSFDEPVDVLRHLKLTGVNALSRQSAANPVSGPTFIRRFPRMLDGRCHLTYRTIRIILKKIDNV